jgi:hypothetical protein
MKLFLYSHEKENLMGLHLPLGRGREWAICSIEEWIEDVELEETFCKGFSKVNQPGPGPGKNRRSPRNFGREFIALS